MLATRTRETVNINKTITDEGVNVVNMEARISSDLDEEIRKTLTILNAHKYYENVEEIDEKVAEFDALFEERRRELYDYYHGGENGEGDLPE